MPAHVSELSSLYKFPLGRGAFALQHVGLRARELGAAEITELAERSAAEVRSLMSLTLRRDASHSSQYPPETADKDAQVDRCLGGVDAYLDSQIRVYPGEVRAQAAGRLQRALLPEGVAAVTHLPYAEQHQQVNILLERARDEDLQGDIAALPEFVDVQDRLTMRNMEYGELLRQSDEVPTSEQLRAGKRRCQDLVTSVMALIIGLYELRAPTSAPERDRLLEPILIQNEALRQARRRRRNPTDIDPQTGEELPEPPILELPESADSTGVQTS